MSTVRKIVKNTGVLMASQIIGYALSFFYGVYTARYLGAKEFGIYSFAIAFTSIFSVFADLGFGSLIIREIARDKSVAEKYLGNIAMIKLILATTTFGLISLTINLLGYPKQTIYVVCLLGLSVVCTILGNLFDSIAQAYEKMEYNSVGKILNSAMILIGVLFAISQKFDVVGFAFVCVIANAISLIYSIAVCLYKFVIPKIEIDWSFWKSVTKEALPFGLTTIFVTNFHFINQVMLSLINGDAVVGWYSAAYRLSLISLAIPATFMTAIYPVMSKFFKNSPNSLNFSLEKSFKFLAVIGFPIAVGTTFLAKKFILSVFGVEYDNSIIALQILAWATFFIYMDNAPANLLCSINKQIIITKVMGFALVSNIILNIILIPRYGLIGASIASALTQFVVMLLVWIGSAKYGYNIFTKVFFDIIAKTFIASILMGIFITIFYNLTLWFLVPLSALFYFIVLYVIGGLNKEDIKLIKKINV